MATAFFLSSPTLASIGVDRVIREAESLSLIHNRSQASAVLLRALNKARPPEAGVLRDKLFQLTRFFYSDKGLQAYQVGLEFFAQEKFFDAIEKFAESDEFEKGNIDVLHNLALSQYMTKKLDAAESTIQKGLQLCPLDRELHRDMLAVLVAQEKWSEALKKADQLAQEFNDNSGQTLKERGLALYKLSQKTEAKKALEIALKQAPQHPEIYYWLSQIKDDTKLIMKYVEICKNKKIVKIRRELELCGQVAQAEKKLKVRK